MQILTDIALGVLAVWALSAIYYVIVVTRQVARALRAIESTIEGRP